jgi:hypothetical protein
MKTNQRNSRLKLLSVATGLALIFLGGTSQSVVAQATNTFPTTGNAGAGTTTPAVTLESSVNVAADTPVLRLSNRDTTGWSPNLEFWSGYGGGKVTTVFRSQASGTNGGFFDLQVRDQTTNLLKSRLFIDNAGNVGIGTNSPGARFAVTANTAATNATVTVTPDGTNNYYAGNNHDALFVDGSLMGPHGNYSSAIVRLLRLRAQTGLDVVTIGRTGDMLVSPETRFAPYSLKLGPDASNSYYAGSDYDILLINGTGLGNHGVYTGKTLRPLRVTNASGGDAFVIARDGNATFGGNVTVTGAVNSAGGFCINGDCKTAWSQLGGGGGSSPWTPSGSNVYFTGGNVGIGTTSPAGPIDVRDSSGRQILWNMPASGHTFLSANGGNVHVSANLYFNGTNWNRINTAAPGGMWWAGGDGTLGVLQTGAGANPVSAFSWPFFINTNGNIGIGTASPMQGKLVLSDTTPSAARIVLSGQEFYQAGNTSTDGIAFLLGVNRTGNRQLWFADSAAQTPNSTNTVIRISPNIAAIDALSTDATVNKQLQVGNGAGVYMPGNVGIGTLGPSYKLDVAGSVRSSSGGFIFPDGTVQTTAATGGGGGSQWTTSGSNLSYSAGNVGIGTTSPDSLAKLHVFGTGGFGQDIQTASNDWTRLRFVTPARTWGFFLDGGSAGLGPGKFGLYDYTGNAWRMVADTNGNVGIGTTNPTKKLEVNGDANVTGTITAGTINAKYQDVAEWVPTTHALSSGTVVVLNPTQSNQVMASAQAYDTRVAGVISEKPGITLGEAGADRVLVATTGRVLVKVDATRGPIHVGDLLVTSDQEGVAMKSVPVNLGGIELHRPGTIIGKALEPLEKGKGEILVLLSLQ